MAQHLSLNTVIHAAIRRDLGRFRDALGDPRAGSAERADQLGRAWDNLDRQLYHHHHSEETIFWPALSALGADGSLVGDLDGEHQRLADAMTATRSAMASLRAAPTQAAAADAQQAFVVLTEVAETHFAHEERDLEPMMVRAHGTPEFRAAERAVRRTQSLPEAGLYLAWLQDDADPDSLAYIRKTIPPPLLALLALLFGRRYRAVSAAWA